MRTKFGKELSSPDYEVTITSYTQAFPDNKAEQNM